MVIERSVTVTTGCFILV